MTRVIGIYGASGFGREVFPVVRSALRSNDAKLVFIDDGPAPADPIGSTEILTWDAFLGHPADDRSVAIAIADSAVRSKLFARCNDAGIAMHEVTAVNALIGDRVSIGEGAILQPFTMLTADVRIGRGFHANIYSYVAHDCMIGDFVTFAPRVMCNGNVHIEDGAYVGTGAILKQGTPDNPLVIGAGAVIGMGAVVTKNVAAGAVVVGNPAKPLEKRS